MVRYTLEEKLAISEIYERTNSIVRTQKEFQQKFGKKPPSELMIRYQQTKLHETGAVSRRIYQRNSPVLTPTKIDEILKFFAANPKCSLSRAAKQLQVSKTSLQRAVRSETAATESHSESAEAATDGAVQRELLSDESSPPPPSATATKKRSNERTKPARKRSGKKVDKEDGVKTTKVVTKRSRSKVRDEPVVNDQECDKADAQEGS